MIYNNTLQHGHMVRGQQNYPKSQACITVLGSESFEVMTDWLNKKSTCSVCCRLQNDTKPVKMMCLKSEFPLASIPEANCQVISMLLKLISARFQWNMADRFTMIQTTSGCILVTIETIRPMVFKIISKAISMKFIAARALLFLQIQIMYFQNEKIRLSLN